jgi:hypothetical protein
MYGLSRRDLIAQQQKLRFESLLADTVSKRYMSANKQSTEKFSTIELFIFYKNTVTYKAGKNGSSTNLQTA